jgi:hypothetical protein
VQSFAVHWYQTDCLREDLERIWRKGGRVMMKQQAEDEVLMMQMEQQVVNLSMTWVKTKISAEQPLVRNCCCCIAKTLIAKLRFEVMIEDWWLKTGWLNLTTNLKEPKTQEMEVLKLLKWRQQIRMAAQNETL